MSQQKKIFVLGGTGPAGICLLRELAHRKHESIVYARNPSKIPEDLASSPYLEIIQGEMDDREKLSQALANCSTVISLLGPTLNNRNISVTMYRDIYSGLFTLMRQNGVHRILAMGTPSIQRPEDHRSLLHQLIMWSMWLIFNPLYHNVIGIANVFDTEAHDLDWTVYRIGAIPGESDEASWRKDREAGPMFTGWVAEKGWTLTTPRGAVARWLVDAAEGKADAWIGKMPAISLHSTK